MKRVKSKKSKILIFGLSVILNAAFSAGFSNTAEERGVIGIWQDNYMVAAGYSNRYKFYEDGFYIFSSSQMDIDKKLLHESGTWSISKGKLILRAEKRVMQNMTDREAGYSGEGVFEGDDKVKKSLVNVNIEKELSINSKRQPGGELLHDFIVIDGVEFYDFSSYAWMADDYFFALAELGGSQKANPDHVVESVAAKDAKLGKNDFKITYPDKSSATYDGQYKPLILNGSLIKCDVKTLNDRTLVPIRIISETLGCDVYWDDALRKVTVKSAGKSIEMIIGSTSATINGSKLTIDSPPAIFDSRTFVPLRFVSEAMNAKVSYAASNVDSKNENDLKVVQNVQGNVIIDSDSSIHFISREGALQDAVSRINSLLQEFKAYYSGLHKGDYLQGTYNLIEDDILGTEIVGETSCYYVMSGAKFFLYNKYTGSIHFYYGEPDKRTLMTLASGRDSYPIFAAAYFD
ncbi:MAG: copper amine oxidase N-terminal domain-containing protein [Clostridiales bacterium]|jgi:hypothetical protein|nr:copper amine oxidase N-terminal domain-containing protein [Clostridiales bacterium]